MAVEEVEAMQPSAESAPAQAYSDQPPSRRTVMASETTLGISSRQGFFCLLVVAATAGFLGARRFGSTTQRRKSCLILDRDRYRYQIFCSDISGQDIRAHGNDVSQALTAVHNWLQANLPSSRPLPGPSTLIARYIEFRRQLPFMCRLEKLRVSELTFLDYQKLVIAWIAVNPR